MICAFLRGSGLGIVEDDAREKLPGELVQMST